MKKNKRKEEALNLLKQGWETQFMPDYYYTELDWYCTAGELARELGISENSASNLLRRLWRQGLARRKKKKGEKIIYWISKKGRKRQKFFEYESMRLF